MDDSTIFRKTYNNHLDCTFSGIPIRSLIRMARAYPLHRHKYIDLRRLHKGDRITRTAALKVDESYKQLFVLPAPNVSTVKRPVSMLNYPIRYNDCEKNKKNVSEQEL